MRSLYVNCTFWVQIKLFSFCSLKLNSINFLIIMIQFSNRHFLHLLYNLKYCVQQLFMDFFNVLTSIDYLPVFAFQFVKIVSCLALQFCFLEPLLAPFTSRALRFLVDVQKSYEIRTWKSLVCFLAPFQIFSRICGCVSCSRSSISVLKKTLQKLL